MKFRFNLNNFIFANIFLVFTWQYLITYTIRHHILGHISKISFVTPNLHHCLYIFCYLQITCYCLQTSCIEPRHYFRRSVHMEFYVSSLCCGRFPVFLRGACNLFLFDVACSCFPQLDLRDVRMLIYWVCLITRMYMYMNN